MRDLLLRGMVAGVIASVFAFGFAAAIGEPPLQRAIDFEEANALHAHEAASAGSPTEAAEAEAVSRGMQRSGGLAVGLIALGVAFGGVFAITYAFARGRLGRMSDRATALTVAGLSFVAVYLVPFLKYPANPPAVGVAETIGARTVAYVGMFLLSVLITLGAVLLQRSLARTRGGWDASIIAAATFAGAFALAMLVLPSFNELPEAFPADVLWQFRLASMGTQLVLWLGIGLTFGLLTERAARARS